jgi:rhodanese-related sulfurtransferase
MAVTTISFPEDASSSPTVANGTAAMSPAASTLPVHDIPASTGELPRGVPLAVHCGHDYRATLGASLLERVGHRDLVMVEDGWEGWVALDADPA